MAEKKYTGQFSSVDDIRRDFEVPESEENFPTDGEVLFADYDTPPYEGDAFVFYRREGKLWEVHGGHCSCYGLEGQWRPEETTVEAVAMRPMAKEEGERGEGLRAAIVRASHTEERG